jgi:predicted DsbA family dithiol-disulfide isomerase
VRLHKINQEYKDRVVLRERPFPLEIFMGESAPRDILEQEWWLAAIQEPEAPFKPFAGDDWPTTTMPAFRAAWSVSQMEPSQSLDFDLRIRRAFFYEGRNIGKRETMLDLAQEASLDLSAFTRLLDSEASLEEVAKEGKIGKEQFHVRGTPTLMISNGKRLRHPIAYPRFKDRKIISVDRLTCIAEGCMDITRGFFEQAIKGSHE